MWRTLALDSFWRFGLAGAQALLDPLLPYFTWGRKLWGDGGYRGAEFATWVKTHRPKLEVEVIQRRAAASGLQLLPRRWVVERTFAWLIQHRRLVRDYEQSERSATGWIFAALIHVMLHRLA